MKKNICLLFAAVLFSGCVSAAKYKTQTGRLDSVQKDLTAVKADYQNKEKGLNDRVEELNSQLARAGVQTAALQKSNKDQQEALEAKKGELNKKISDIIKERDELAKNLADTAAAMDAQRRSNAEALAKAETEKKAVEQEKEIEIAAVKKNYEDLTSGLKAEITAGEITITQLKGKLTVNMVDKILFDSGMAEVRGEGRKVLGSIGKVLKDITNKDIRIEGHTDNIPIKGELKSKYPTNWELSTARATAVARYLQDEAKVTPERLVAAGYGEYRPVALNDTAENRALNRRIEIVLTAREE
ncbi:MAG: hypothetical protein A2X34_02775 [Elusimicrobia bacterium GWC2_51_8]|nr:MAG: hypothetical protein A2X33_03080 [Elusimicrobia bacterium GWA2_51_34]OGR58778.1 MAG: hypothetical protein A2X34_02775 [Elusimicrobia bacterium GWC2_51_8]OGR84835.1 MAG: hypothetical protein A2021_01320 [Elusimicrobia bacterium GWF2_52_66]